MSDDKLVKRGTMECPYCGKDTPHHHSQKEIAGLTPGLRNRLEKLAKELPAVGFYSAMHRACGTDYSHLAEAALERDLRQVIGKLEALAALQSERASMEGEIERLREALTEIEKHGFGAALDWSEKECAEYWSKLALKYRRIARAALTSSKTGATAGLQPEAKKSA